MDETPDDNPPRKISAEGELSRSVSVCFNGRQIDIAGLRQWFIKRIAAEVADEIAKESKDGNQD